tara:strand:+ start:15 stop:461 length:447 start_codon:yes stop_codon:yes gene_type:complete
VVAIHEFDFVGACRDTITELKSWLGGNGLMQRDQPYSCHGSGRYASQPVFFAANNLFDKPSADDIRDYLSPMLRRSELVFLTQARDSLDDFAFNRRDLILGLSFVIGHAEKLRQFENDDNPWGRGNRAYELQGLKLQQALGTSVGLAD